jgi:UDP-glucose 4-epimerase
MAILITGGFGYIGSHVSKYLTEKKYEIVILDNLSKGHKIKFNNCPNYIGDIGDKDLIKYICQNHDIDAIFHFAAQTTVVESTINPEIYYIENISKSISMLEEARKHNVNKIVFASSATVFGYPPSLPITEEHPKVPINAYGRSKLMFEEILDDYEKAYNIKSICLRFFNAAGADLSGRIGEDHNPECHLIPNVFKTILGQLEYLSIYGNDYKTKDGTTIRNYVHVLDIAQAFELSVRALYDGCNSSTYNLGDGQGHSIFDIIKIAKKITQKDVPYKIFPKRNGDLPVTVSIADKIKKELGWNPKYSDLATILNTAWKWHSEHPLGYDKT